MFAVEILLLYSQTLNEYLSVFLSRKFANKLKNYIAVHSLDEKETAPSPIKILLSPINCQNKNVKYSHTAVSRFIICNFNVVRSLFESNSKSDNVTCIP